MLGYVRAAMPELRLRDYECYRAYYCGLCKAMGKCTGNCSRLSLSYDFVFFAALRVSLLGEKSEQKYGRCLLHPFKKRKIVRNSPTLAYCADAAALVTYHKCRDDVTDEKGFKRLRGRFASVFFRRAYRKAKKRHPDLDRVLRERLGELRAFESDTSLPPSADVPAAISGRMLEALFTEGLDGDNARIMATLGYNVGRWVYLVDAADDFAADKKAGRFNPFLRLFGDEPTDTDREDLRLSLMGILREADCAFQLIDRYPQPELLEILSNILYLGLPAAADAVLNKNTTKEQHESK